jgi:hypothetical protein
LLYFAAVRGPEQLQIFRQNRGERASIDIQRIESDGILKRGEARMKAAAA